MAHNHPAGFVARFSPRRLFQALRAGARRAGRRPPSFRPGLEELETRALPSLAVDVSLVKDINLAGNSNPSALTNVGGVLFFTADDGTSGRELWRVDGNGKGVTRVKDIRPGATGSDPVNLVNVNGTLFFTADDGTNGLELWKSYGTAAGTTRIQDINAGAYSGASFLTNVNGLVFFRGFDGTSGQELWRSDGTAAGTTRVQDIRPGSAGSDPFNLTNVNGALFFRANDGTAGRELWKSTAAGTTLVKDIDLSISTVANQGMVVVNRKDQPPAISRATG